MTKKIVIVDDERIIRVSLADDLRERGYEVVEFSEPNAVLLYIKDNFVDIVISDYKMPNYDGIELLKRIKKINQNINFILMTAYASYPIAVESIKLGALDFITKPFKNEELAFKIDRIFEIRKESPKIEIKKPEDGIANYYSEFIGESSTIKELFNLINLVSNTNTTVLITGETGTGKELLSTIVHNNSSRKNNPFIKVSCAILSKDIFESELFGHIKGAFTGAEKNKEGRFELANNGTLYLDDIDDIPIELQVKLLRAIEQQEIERVGSAESIKINVRIIASTKTSLKKLVEEGRFREDLYYRLNVFPINIPPLRERKDDIPILIRHFINTFSNEKKYFIENDVFDLLKNFDWNGNVRELKNICERMFVLAGNNEKITKNIIPIELINIYNESHNVDFNYKLNKYESDILIDALNKFNGNKLKAAEFLGIPHSTLRSKLDKLNIK